MAKNYDSAGYSVNYTNGGGTTISSGAVVVLGALIGVALTDIKPGETGGVAIKGAWHVPKATAALTQGQRIDYDVSTSKVAAIGTPATGDLVGCGVVLEAAASGAATALVAINERGAEVTA